MKYMWTTFEEYAALMDIPKSHPYWNAFQIVWNMSRSKFDDEGNICV